MIRANPVPVMSTISLVALMISSSICLGFTITQPQYSDNHKIRRSKSSTTSLNLEDWVADMVDNEYYRQNHKKEFQEAWMAKNKGAVLKSLSSTGAATAIETSPTALLLDQEPEEQDFRQLLKDRRLAKRDPHQYCADRCIATGNCDVYEDLFDFTPEEVMAFCSDCVLAEDEEHECEIPEKFYDISDFENLKP